MSSSVSELGFRSISLKLSSVLVIHRSRASPSMLSSSSLSLILCSDVDRSSTQAHRIIQRSPWAITWPSRSWLSDEAPELRSGSKKMKWLTRLTFGCKRCGQKVKISQNVIIYGGIKTVSQQKFWCKFNFQRLLGRKSCAEVFIKKEKNIQGLVHLTSIRWKFTFMLNFKFRAPLFEAVNVRINSRSDASVR